MRPIKMKIPRAKSSHLERKFLLYWKAICTCIELEREVRFHETRKWRFDFAHRRAMVAVEIEGVSPKMGRHQSIGGFKADAEKYFVATSNGWTVFRLTSDLITLYNVSVINNTIISKLDSAPIQGATH